MLRMFQSTMLGPTNKTPFTDLSMQEGLVLSTIIGVIIFFGIYPKPIVDLITPSLIEIVSYIK